MKERIHTIALHVHLKVTMRYQINAVIRTGEKLTSHTESSFCDRTCDLSNDGVFLFS